MFRQTVRGLIPVVALLVAAACEDAPTSPAAVPEVAGPSFAKGGIPGKPGGTGETTAASNLSFPTIWAEGVSKDPRGTMGTVQLDGAWWYWWGEPLVEDGDPLACAPDPDDPSRCDDALPNQASGPYPGTGAIQAYLQKSALNEWQADNASATAVVNVDRIDWGDALEAVPWTLRSKVRIEATLFEDVASPMTGYTMHHTSGHGIDEMWAVDAGLNQTAVTYESSEALVFSPCARLTIQKLLVPREDLLPLDPSLTWNTTTHLWQGTPISETAVFNGAIAPEGPGGGFGAEINIQGKVVYGMTWDVKTANEGAGDYRLTFSLADDNCAASLNTFITAATQIIVPIEEEITVLAEPTAGGVAVVDGPDNLTYIDIRIEAKTGGGSKPSRGTS